MSNLDTKTINSDNIAVTNLIVTNINGIPYKRGYTQCFSNFSSSPIEGGGPITVIIETGLAYITGNCILVSNHLDPFNNKFEATVLSYDSVTGSLVFTDIINLIGIWTAETRASINLNGINGQLSGSNSIFLVEELKKLNSKSTLYNNSINSVVSITMKDVYDKYYVGSGFFIEGTDSTKYGYILTAAHVITDTNSKSVANNIWINTYYPNNVIYKINDSSNIVMGYDKTSDIALIRITGPNFQPLKIKDSRTKCNIGDFINTIGYPGGLDEQSFSRGVIRDNKSELTGSIMESVLTDISIYGGNSGGPLITDDGYVVGVVSYGYETEINGGIASYLFTPIVKYFMDNYNDTILSYPKGYIGISYNPVNTLYAAVKFNLNTSEGYYVINKDSSIVPANFNTNDIITEFNGVKVGVYNNMYPLFTEIFLLQPGTKNVSVKYRPENNWSTVLTKTINISSFNPSNDYIFSNYNRIPILLANIDLTNEG